MSAQVSSAEAQKARAFLYSHHKRGFRIPPKKFAAAAKELGMGFRELIRFLARLYMRGQQRSVFREEAIQRHLRGGSQK
jgi:hypothetical protein